MPTSRHFEPDWVHMPAEQRPLRIAMTSYYLPSGSKIGVGYQVHALANGLVDRGHDVTIFSGCPASSGARYRTVQLPAPRRWRTFAFARSIARLDLSAFDVLHAHGDDYWLWRPRVLIHVRTVHGSCFEEARRIPGLREKLRMLALGFSEVLASLVADRTAVVSPQTRRWLPWVTTVIPNGVDDSVFRPDPELRADVPTILFVGTYGNRKRGRLLMEVFAQEVRPALPDARLVMVCSDAPDAPGVIRTGRIDDAELARWYARAWVFSLPSSYEGFGIPYAEALMSGLPVVATPNPGARYVLDGCTAASLVPEGQLGAALLERLRDPDPSTTALASVAHAVQFRLSEVLDQYETLYRSTVVPPVRTVFRGSRADHPTHS